MGIEHRVHRDCKVVVSTLCGEVSAQDLLDDQERFWTNPALAGFNELIDFTNATKTEGSVEDIRELARRAYAIDALTPTKTAVVARAPLAVTGSHIFKAVRESFPQNAREIRVFISLQEAQAWLGLPADAQPVRQSGNRA
jgi:hypothetical protein